VALMLVVSGSNDADARAIVELVPELDGAVD
jgi:hypothetical protein